MGTTDNLDLLTIEDGAGGQIDHNTNMQQIDAIMPCVIQTLQNSPPGSPTEGHRYIVGGTPTGDWVGHDDEVALYKNAAWIFYPAVIGMWAVQAAATDDAYKYKGGTGGTGGKCGRALAPPRRAA